ncbi:MAG: PLDc N-terminal domain-containing protein [Ktedonobacteraceae bacterium]
MPADRGCFFNSCLFLTIVFLPIVGQIIVTLMIFEDQHSPATILLWLIVVWPLPFLGPFLYLLFGQTTSQRGRVMFAQPSYTSM